MNNILTMGRVTPTREYVRIIAQELLSGGTSPTQSKIRELIKARYGITPSPNVVGDELDQFWKSIKSSPAQQQALVNPNVTRPNDPVVAVASSGALPASLPRSVDLVERTVTGTQSAVELSRESVRVQDLRQSLAEAQQTIEELNDQVARGQSELTTVQATCSSLRLELQESTARLLSASSELKAQKDTLEALEAAHERQLSELKELYQGQIDALRAEKARDFEIWDGMRKHLMMETDRIREEQTLRFGNIKEKLASSQMFEEQWRRQATQLTEDLAKASRRAADAEERLNQLLLAERSAAPAVKPPAVQATTRPVALDDDDDNE